MYRMIVLAYDGTLEGRLALREGARLAQICGAQVLLMAVVEPPPVYVGDLGTVYTPEDRTPYAQRILDEGLERLQRMGLQPKSRLMVGDPADCIRHVADEVGADLVVVGHHKQGALSRWLLGSVTDALTNTLSCSLLVARLEIPDDVLFAAGAAQPAHDGA